VKSHEEWEPPDFNALRAALKLDDPEYFLRFPVSAVYTDGSYTPRTCTPMDIFSTKQSLNSGGSGGIGIAWMGEDNPSQGWRTQVPRFLHINTNAQKGLNSFACELLGQIISYHLSDPHLDNSVPTKSDCKAALARLLASKNSLHVPLGHAKYGVFLESLIAAAGFIIRSSEWVRSHPENRHDSTATFSYDDHGIFLADAAAAGEWNTVRKHLGNQQFLKKSVDIDDLLEMLISPEVPHWRDSEGTLVTEDLLGLADQYRLHQYTHTRDYVYRAKMGLPPKWSGSNPALAMSATTIPPKYSHSAKRQAIARIWGKSYAFGDNRAKGLLGQEQDAARKCDDCDEPDSVAHMLLHCQHPESAALRERAADEQMLHFNRMKIDPDIPRLMTEPLGLYVKSCHDRACPYTDQLWTGMFTPDQFALFFPVPLSDGTSSSLKTITTREFRIFRTQLIALMKPLIFAQQRMTQSRSRRFLAANKPKRRQYTRQTTDAPTYRPIDPAVRAFFRLPPRPIRNKTSAPRQHAASSIASRQTPHTRTNNTLNNDSHSIVTSSLDTNNIIQGRQQGGQKKTRTWNTSQARIIRLYQDELHTQSDSQTPPTSLRLGSYEDQLVSQTTQSSNYSSFASPCMMHVDSAPPEGLPPD